MKKLLNAAFAYGIAGIVMGVAYRETSKLLGFTSPTALARVHTHLFALGMLFCLVLLALDKGFGLYADGKFKGIFALYNTGVIGAAAMMTLRGMTQVFGMALNRGADAALSGVSGIFHILLTVALVRLFLLLGRRVAACEQRA